MAFRVGQKVVCVDADFSLALAFPRVRNINLPVEQEVYTIRELTTAFVPGTLSLALTELQNPKIYFRDGTCCEPYFSARRFRPVVSRKTSIEIFERMLTPSPARVKDFCGND